MTAKKVIIILIGSILVLFFWQLNFTDNNIYYLKAFYSTVAFLVIYVSIKIFFEKAIVKTIKASKSRCSKSCKKIF